MPDNTNRTTYVRETEKRSGTSIAFIVGGLVVAVAFLVWLFAGGDVGVSSNGASGGDTSTTNVTIQPAPEAAPEAAPQAAPEAAPEAAAPAPAGN